MEVAAGELFLIATPIGNLADITLRALETLREVDLVAAEDTRTAKKLFSRYQIKTPLISLHDNSSVKRLADLLKKLQDGEAVGVISEAGTPGISDPGYRLIQLAAAAAIRITPLPGACAAVAALCASALPLDSFYFAGFLPPRSGPRQRRLESLKEIEATLIFYESPRRLNATLETLEKVLGDRPACVARELTKIHEEFLRYPLSHLRSLGCERNWRGEITLLVAGCDLESRNRDPQTLLEEEAKLQARLADPEFVKDYSNRDLVELLMTEFPLLKRRRIYEIVLSIEP
ncbi:MAG: 16S rRNA (cytidine(1402)-2'-O)-methyltransferase [Deltaproteobacteria bacterium]|nr:16S rRNA (cytidine(1402)-2'-O)-methyltransferase [Candidatus Tharpella sp.]